MYFLTLVTYNNLNYRIQKLSAIITNLFLFNTKIIFTFFTLNDLIWQEGLLIDFLQKKILNNWMLKFLVFASYLFNERLLFDKLIKFYLFLIIWPFQNLSVFDLNNVSNLFFVTLFIFLFFYFFIFLINFIMF